MSLIGGLLGGCCFAGCGGLTNVGACDTGIVGAASCGFVGTGLTITGSSSASGASWMSEYLFSWFGRFKMLFTLGSVGETMTFGTTSSSVYRASSLPLRGKLFEGAISVGL